MYNSLYKSYEKKYWNQSGGMTAVMHNPTQVVPVSQKEENKASEKKALPLATAPQSNTVNLLILDSDDLETKLQKLETRLNIVSDRVSIESGRLTDFMYNGIKDARLGD